MLGVGLFSLVFFSASSSSQATVTPVPPPIALQTRLLPMDVLNKGEGEKLERIQNMTRILEEPPEPPLYVTSIGSI